MASFLAMAAIALLLAIFSSKPSNELDFATAYKILPSATLEGDQLTIHKLRDFTYHSDGSIHAANYLDKNFSLNELTQVWLGISHFQAGGLAHIFLSFEFSANGSPADTEYLSVSIEARLTQNDDHYSPVKGLFRQYTKTLVLATEQDIIGLRSHIRGERVLLYPLRMDNIQRQALLLNFTRMSNDLIQHPVFYNTLSDNCLTGLMAQSYYFQKDSHRLDYRVLLPGYVDGLAHELGIINLQGSLESIRQQATIETKNVDIQDPHFSQLIRHKKLTNASAVSIKP